MKRYLPFAFMAFILSSDIALSAIIKETKQGKSIEFYTNETGTVEKKAEITPGGQLRINEVQDLAGTGTPPGMVPIGGMVAVMPNTHANTWQPPATGVIKDGFMRANGHTITSQNVIDGSLIPEGTALPNMVDRFARGATTSNTQLGSDSVTPSGTVSQPSFAGDAESRSTWFKSQGISATTKGHYHSMSGDGTTLDVDSLGATNASLANGQMSASEFEHNHSLTGSVSGGTASLTGTTTFVTGVNDHTFTNPKVPAHYHSEANHISGLSTSVTVNSLGNGVSDTAQVSTHGHTHGSGTYVAYVGAEGTTLKVGRSNTDFTADVKANLAWYGVSETSGWSTRVGGTSSGATSYTNAYIDIDHGHSASGSTVGYVGQDSGDGGCNGDSATDCTTTGGAVSNHSIDDGTVGINSTAANNGDLGVGADDISTERTVTGTTNIAHGHGLTGSIGKVTSGCDGDTDGSCSVTFNVNNDDMQEWSAAGDYTPSGTVSQPSFSGNALDNKPAYTTVVWVIRVM